MAAFQSIHRSIHTSDHHGLIRVAQLPGMRALAWSGDQLYAAQGYQLLRARVDDLSDPKWESIAGLHPDLKHRFTVSNRMTARLFRDGFHALAVLSLGHPASECLVAAVAGAIVSRRAGENEFRLTHRIRRGTRPLHLTAVPNGSVFWGEYFDNSARDEVHIYGSQDGEAWEVAHTFPKGAIRHVHNIVYDRWEDCLWVLTGDYGNECRILRADCDFGHVETVLEGNQQARAVALVPMQDGLYFSSDTPLEQNFIYRLDRGGAVAPLTPISSSSIYGCKVGEQIFFSTMIEPSRVNRDRHVRVYSGRSGQSPWRPLLEWKKDLWPMRLFQYGNAFLPDGENSTTYLALTTIAVKLDDQVTSIYQVRV